MNGTVAYLTKRFPRLSETFILDEILGLEACGVPLRLYSIMDPREPVVQPDARRVRSPITYLHRGTTRRAALAESGDTVRAHVGLLVRRPAGYARALAYVARRRCGPATLRHFLEGGNLAALLERDKAYHLHAAFAHGPASIAYFVHLLTGLPFSFSAHAKDLYLSDPQLLARKIRAAQFVLVCSEAAAGRLREIAGPAASKVRLAYHGVDTDRFQPPSGKHGISAGCTAAEPLRLLAVGRLVEKKGYPTLLDALARVVASGRPVRCEIIGAGPLRAALEARIKELGSTDTVSLRGPRTHQEVAAAYHEADVFVQASVVLADGDRDGVPNSVLEAMASGLPVVASAVAGIPEVVLDGATGVLFPPGDAGALAGALIGLIDDPRTRQRLGQAARAYVVERLDRTNAVRAIAPLFSCPRAASVGRTT